jgi:hypothetical protein
MREAFSTNLKGIPPMAYVRPFYDFTDIPMAFECMTTDQAREASAAALAGEVIAESFYGRSVADAERYKTPIFSVCYVVSGYVAFRNYAYTHVANNFAANDAYRAQIASN